MVLAGAPCARCRACLAAALGNGRRGLAGAGEGAGAGKEAGVGGSERRRRGRPAASASAVAAAAVEAAAATSGRLKIRAADPLNPGIGSDLLPMGLAHEGLPQASPAVNLSARARVELWPEQHGLTERRAIRQPVWEVLRRLRRGGHEAYLVGGVVRDLLCGLPPKDYDIVTSASLKEVKQRFGRQCFVVGKRFPVAHVELKGLQMEVTSFALNSENSFEGNLGEGALPKFLDTDNLRRTPEYQRAWDAVRRGDAIRRDFTVNALLYDPFAGCLYDYVGGLWALKRRQIRSIVPPVASFMEDPARILRAVRFAGRTGFRIESGTLEGLQSNVHLLRELPKARLMLEVNALLAHGAAAPSFLLLWRLKILDELFPGVARHLRERENVRGSRRTVSAKDVEENSRIYRNLQELDRRVESPAKPVESAVWVACLAMPMVEEEEVEDESEFGDAGEEGEEGHSAAASNAITDADADSVGDEVFAAKLNTAMSQMTLDAAPDLAASGRSSCAVATRNSAARAASLVLRLREEHRHFFRRGGAADRTALVGRLLELSEELPEPPARRRSRPRRGRASFEGRRERRGPNGAR